MTRRVLAAAVLGAAAWMVVSSEQASAHGRRAGCGSAPACATSCYTGCAPAMQVVWVDQEVTCYKTETVTTQVETTVHELKPKTEKYKYTVYTPTTVKEKVTVCEYQTVAQPYKYTVMQMVAEPAKVKVCQPKMVSKEVEYTWNECVTKTKPGKSTVWDVVCEPKVVTCMVPTYKTVTVPVCAPAAGCGHPCGTGCGTPCGVAYTCQRVCEMVPSTYTVMERKMVSREVDVQICYHEWVSHKGKKTVHECVHEWVEVDSVVHKCVPVEKDGVRHVCQLVNVVKEIDVCKHVATEKDGERTVYETVAVKKMVPHTSCVTVPYKTVVKVATYVPCAPACPAPCAPAPACCN